MDEKTVDGKTETWNFSDGDCWKTTVDKQGDSIYIHRISGSGFILIALWHEGMGDYDKAIADCDEAIRLDMNNAGAYHTRGETYQQKGDYDRAIADCTRAIELGTGTAYWLRWGYYSRTVAYHGKGDYDKAVADYTRAIELKLDFSKAYYNRGVAYHRRGDNERGLADLNKAVELDSDYADALQYLNESGLRTE